MAEKESIGYTSIGFGAFIFAIGIIFLVLTFLKITPNRSWIISWINNYIISAVSIVLGLILLGYGVYMRSVIGKYTRKVEILEKEKAKQDRLIKHKTVALEKKQSELKRKGTVLLLTKGKLRESRKMAKHKTKQMLRVRGKLGDRSKRLKKIREIARVSKK